MIVYEKTTPIIRRTAIITDTTDKILRFGMDNLYPQRMEEVFKRSSSLKAVYNRISDFIYGEGFADPNIAKMILNPTGLKGSSANRVLKQMAPTFTKWTTLCGHVNYNMLGEMCSITPVPFEFVRLGLRNKQGCIEKYAYSNNWERDSLARNDFRIKFYDKFNPNRDVVLQQIDHAKGISNYCGQLIYLTPIPDTYPDAAFDSVSDDAQTQGELAITRLSSVVNQFLSTMAILYPGEFTDEQDKQNFLNLVANKSGSRAAGSRIGLQDKTGLKKASDIFVNLDPVSIDKLYELTETTTRRNILEHEAFPEILLGKSPNGFFAQGDMEESYTYVNSITRNRRSELSEAFSILLSFWETPIITDAKIIELRYLPDSVAGGQAVNINDNLKNMTGMQAINFERILRKYSKGTYSRQIATGMLSQGYGFELDEINKMLDAIDQLNQEEAATQPTGGTVAWFKRKVKRLLK